MKQKNSPVHFETPKPAVVATDHQVSKQPENSRWQFDFLDWPWHNRKRRSLDFSVFRGDHMFNKIWYMIYFFYLQNLDYLLILFILMFCLLVYTYLAKLLCLLRDGLLPVRNISDGCSLWIQEEKSRSRSWSPTGGGLVGSADSKFKVGTMTTGGAMSNL